MAKVTNHNGDNHSTADGMTHYRFSGTSIDQYEHIPQVGEQRVIKVAVTCVGTGLDQISDGVRHLSKWRVTNAEIGDLIEATTDPQLEFGDDDEDAPRADYGDYKDGSGDDPEPTDTGDDGTVVSFSDRTTSAAD